MSGDVKKVVIIGGGVAGVSAALAARQHYPSCEIVILSAEPDGYYNRIGIMALAVGDYTPGQLNCFPADYLRQKRIDYRSGITVLSILPNEHQVKTTIGTIPFDKLIIATGAKPFIPPTPGLKEYAQPLWTLEDARQLGAKLQDGPKNVAIVGGGVLAIESALALHEKGCQVTIIELQPQLMGAQLNKPAAVILEKGLSAIGIQVFCQTEITNITKNKQLDITLNNGSILKADLLLSQAGVRPEISLAKEAGLSCGKGIMVNDGMHTSNNDIFACGNCIEIAGSNELLWNPAREQGTVAGANLFKDQATYGTKSHPLHLKSSICQLFCYGNWHEADKISQEMQDNNYRATFFNKEGRLVATILVGDVTSYPLLQKAIDDGVTIDPTAIATMPTRALQPPIVDSDGHEMTWDGRHWVCRQCGYTCEGPIPPAVCPVCHVGRDQFILT